MSTDWTQSGLLPASVASDVLSAAEAASAVMDLADTRPMPTGTEFLPLVETAPTAGWVDQPGDRKPYSEVVWSATKLIARELAIVTSIADEYLSDSGFDAEGSVEQEFASAISTAFDRALLFGIERPAGFPELVSGDPTPGDDALAAIDAGLSVIEGSGVMPTGIISGPQIGSALRQAYREVQALPSQSVEPNVYGVPIRIVADWPADAGFDAIIGAWRFLVVGVRQDLSIEKSSDGVLTNPDGSIRVSAFESDTTLIRCHCRLAAAVGRPVGASGPIQPFVAVSWSGDEAARSAAQRQRGSGGRYASSEKSS